MIRQLLRRLAGFPDVVAPLPPDSRAQITRWQGKYGLAVEDVIEAARLSRGDINGGVAA